MADAEESKIEKSISQIEQVISASLRSMPTETGDGTYVKESKTTGFAKDLPHLDLDDVKTVVDVVKAGATGEPVDDREYIMERVIQVSHCSFPSNYEILRSELMLDRCRAAFNLSEWQTIDRCLPQPIME